MAQEIIKGFSRQLAFCESFSESEKLINCPPSLVHRLDAVGGLKVQSVKLCLKIARVFHPEDFVLVAEPRKVPEAWLPEHANAPSTYTLLLEVKLLLSPAMLFSDGAGSLPGVTSPIPIMISASHQWENLGRNPETGMFFLNE